MSRTRRLEADVEVQLSEEHRRWCNVLAVSGQCYVLYLISTSTRLFPTRHWRLLERFFDHSMNPGE